jgi:hypothetical protein
MRDDIFRYHSGGRGPPNRGSSNAGSSSNTGSTMPQSQQGQNASAQPTGHYHQQGHGHGQAHLGECALTLTSTPPTGTLTSFSATSGQYGQPAATQHVQGSSLGGNTVQTQNATSAPGKQTQQEFKWRNTFPPGNQQVAMGQGSSSSTSTSGLGVGVGAGAHGVSV